MSSGSVHAALTHPNAPSKGKIVVAGIMFWYPLAGVTYQFLHYLIGLRRLGYDVYYIEDSRRGVYDSRIDARSFDVSANVATITPVLEAFGFSGRWAFRSDYPGGSCYGMTENEIRRAYREADALLNVTGAQDISDDQMVCRRRIYVESDPFPTQVGVALNHPNTIAALAAHDAHFSFGENLGAPDCGVPVDNRFQWLPTRQPVVVDMWNGLNPPERPVYTTITTWKNKGKDISFGGETYYWTKHREFEKFLDLPQHRHVPFELATGSDAELRSRLHAHGWLHVDGTSLSRNIDGYRKYIQRSRGEFTVARDQYVRPRTGWFSDRSACYLAAGRPVITQETGFSKFLPTGEGLFAFTTMDDIVAAVDAIESDYNRHSRAAREVAEEYFGAERVLGSLMERAGL